MYYRLAGFGSQIESWFDDDFQYEELSRTTYEILAETSSIKDEDNKKNKASSTIELVLGITPTGASYVLVTEEQRIKLHQYMKKFRRSSKLPPSDKTLIYNSLSPIYFGSASELQQKLSTYRCNCKKIKNEDNSKANKGHRRENTGRAAFEQQRLFWFIINNPMLKTKFMVPNELDLVASTLVISFSYNAWVMESIDKQRTDPTLLELGLTSVACQAFSTGEEYKSQISRSSHVIIKETQMMMGYQQAPFLYGETETLTNTETKSLFGDYFNSINEKQIILLVFDAESSQNALKKLGIGSVIYKSDIGELLYGPDGLQSQLTRRFRATYSQDSSRAIKRERSRSPPRQDPQRPFHRSRSPRRESSRSKLQSDKDHLTNPEMEEKKPLMIYLVDVKSMFLSMSTTNDVSSPSSLASRLGIMVKDSSLCAGNDSHLLIECWMRMASGSAIDEQYEELERRRALLSSSTFEKTEEDTKDALASVPTTDSDDEDPNAIFSENFVAKDSANAVNKNISGQLRPPDDYDYDSDQSFC